MRRGSRPGRLWAGVKEGVAAPSRLARNISPAEAVYTVKQRTLPRPGQGAVGSLRTQSGGGMRAQADAQPSADGQHGGTPLPARSSGG